MDPRKTIFFGYPSRPPILRETITNAAAAIPKTGLAEVMLWEQASGASHLLITDIVRAIDDATLSAFVLTDLNPNVMFEAGYAIGATLELVEVTGSPHATHLRYHVVRDG